MNAVYIIVPTGVALAILSGGIYFLKRRRKGKP